MKRLFVKFFFVVALGVTVFACKKDSETAQQADDKLVQDDSQASAEIEAVFQMTDELLVGDALGGRVEDYSFCGKVDLDKVKKNITIDFGTGGCKGKGNREQKGKIKVSFSDKNPNSGRTITFENYSVNGNLIKGTVTTSAVSKNASGNLEFTRTANIVITFSADSKTHTYNGTHTLAWIEGFGTKSSNDDVFSTTGASSGINREGVSYSNKIVSPLITKTTCFQAGSFCPVSGKTEVVGKTTFTLDFGNGTCDKKVSITISGKTYEIELP